MLIISQGLSALLCWYRIDRQIKHATATKGLLVNQLWLSWFNRYTIEAEAETNPEDPDVIDVPQPEFAGQSTSAHTSFRQIANTKRHVLFSSPIVE